MRQRELFVFLMPLLQAEEEYHKCQEDSEGTKKVSGDQEGHHVPVPTS